MTPREASSISGKGDSKPGRYSLGGRQPASMAGDPERGIEDNREKLYAFPGAVRRGIFHAGGAKTTIVFGLKNEPARFSELCRVALPKLSI